MAGFYALSPKIFIKFLGYIEALSVRYNIICGKSTGEQERAYSKIAGFLSNDSSLSQAVKIMKEIDPSDEETAVGLEEKSFKTQQTDKKVRYLLYRIETQYRGAKPQIELEETTLEHILPRNPTETWISGFDGDEDTEHWIHHLGNMTLRSGKENKALGRKEFKEKKRGFKKSDFEITKQCAKYDCWNKESIRDRQKWLWEKAKALWRLP